MSQFDSPIDMFMDELCKTFKTKEPPSKQIKASWKSLLKRVGIKAANEAVDRLLNDGSVKIYGFPAPAQIIPYLKSVNNILIQCPCCNNSRWLVWWAGNTGTDTTPAYPCSCVNDRNQHGSKGLNICKNLNCTNKAGRTKIYVPPGEGYNQRKLLASCKYKPMIIEDKNWDAYDRTETDTEAKQIISKGLSP